MKVKQRESAAPDSKPAALSSPAPDAANIHLDKPIYTLSVASEILETHPRTLMLYEDVGLVQPFRTTTNRRRYSQRDIRKLQVIQHLTREKGVNLAGVRHILSLFEVLKKRGLQPPPDLKEVFDRYAEIV